MVTYLKSSTSYLRVYKWVEHVECECYTWDYQTSRVFCVLILERTDMNDYIKSNVIQWTINWHPKPFKITSSSSNINLMKGWIFDRLNLLFLHYKENKRNESTVQNLQQFDRPRRLSNFAGVQFLRLVRSVIRLGSSINQRSWRKSLLPCVRHFWLAKGLGETTLWHEHTSFRGIAQCFACDDKLNLSWKIQMCESTIPMCNKLVSVMLLNVINSFLSLRCWCCFLVSFLPIFLYI